VPTRLATMTFREAAVGWYAGLGAGSELVMATSLELWSTLHPMVAVTAMRVMLEDCSTIHQEVSSGGLGRRLQSRRDRGLETLGGAPRTP
jgi:hypothetical protein